MDILKEIENLNDQQKLVVLEKKAKNLLVLAGAGSGKTRVLTVRIAYLLSHGINPNNIFSVTFTNKAAKEMKDRIIALTETNISEMWSGTFHSLSLRLMKDNIPSINLSRNFTIMDDQDQKSLIKNSLSEIWEVEPEKITHKIDNIKEEVKLIQSFINKCKDNELRDDRCDELIKLSAYPQSYKCIYEMYEKKRIAENSCDFSDLILYAVEILRDNSNIRNYYSDKFRYVFVDEFQDTNPIQYRLIDLLKSSKTYQTMVGDDDQLIYSWRGANVDNLVKYKKSNGDVKIIKLEQNYRSTKNILYAANSVVKDNKTRIKKELWSDKEDGSKIKVFECSNQFTESFAVANEIQKLIRQGYKYSDITILYRNNYLSNSFENTLTKNKIPYKIIGGLSFWQRKEIKDVISYLTLIHNYKNNSAFERIINTPKRGFGKKAIQNLKSKSLSENKDLFTTLIKLNKEGAFSKSVSNKITHFIYSIEDFINNNRPLYVLISEIVEVFNIMEEYAKEDIDKRNEREANIHELINYSRMYGETSDNGLNLSSFLQNSMLQSDASNSDEIDCVNLMTVHASKGLEFKNIFMVGFEDGIFPSDRAIMIQEKDLSKLEEERRLAYVAITRAEINLHISFASSRYNKNSQPSRFLNKIPMEIISYHADSEYGLSPYGQKMRALSKAIKGDLFEYTIGDTYICPTKGDGEVMGVEEISEGLILDVDFGFFGSERVVIKI